MYENLALLAAFILIYNATSRRPERPRSPDTPSLNPPNPPFQRGRLIFWFFYKVFLLRLM
jgi:hypothetical protein